MTKRNQNNMPADFEPPVPAWAADWTGQANSLTTAVFGIQSELTADFKAWANSALYDVEFAPELVEMAAFTDLASVKNTVYIAYWRDDNYLKWWANEKVSQWWLSDDRLNEPQGYWREHYRTQVEGIETLHSTPNSHGVSNLSTTLEGPIDEHGYAGSARDRIQVSETGDVSTTKSIGESINHTNESDGKRITIKPPKNMCVIRSGQDWSHCDEDERNSYLQQVHPTLIKGMDYLAKNPAESRCLTMRLMTSVDSECTEVEQTFGLGYGLDIFAFENWAKSHPTHLKIFNTFLEHAGHYAENMQLRLWHEVSILDNDAGHFEYINCHSETGLMAHI